MDAFSAAKDAKTLIKKEPALSSSAGSKAKRKQLDEFGKESQITPADLQLTNVLNDLMGTSGYVWPHKPPAASGAEYEATITIKLKEFVVLKEIIVGCMKAWYVDNTTKGSSDYPSHLVSQSFPSFINLSNYPGVIANHID